MPSQGLDDNNAACTHIVCTTHPCPSHDFDTWPTTLFDAQRDHQHQTASGMKLITLYVFPLLLFSFFFSLSHA